MGNPNLTNMPPNDRISPPFAQPAQPGEIRHCLNCIRCTEAIHKPGVFFVDCEWRGEWFWPSSGCDRWAEHPQPRQSFMKGQDQPEKRLEWVGKGSGTKRRRR